MDFLKLIRSLDELLYEIMSWLIFYPVTLWRALTRPLKMMDYSDAEQGDAEDQQYSDTLSPPLFLLLTLVLCHAVELSLVGQNAVILRRTGLGGLVNDDSTFILLRVAFCADGFDERDADATGAGRQSAVGPRAAPRGLAVVRQLADIVVCAASADRPAARRAPCLARDGRGADRLCRDFADFRGDMKTARVYRAGFDQFPVRRIRRRGSTRWLRGRRPVARR